MGPDPKSYYSMKRTIYGSVKWEGGQLEQQSQAPLMLGGTKVVTAAISTATAGTALCMELPWHAYDYITLSFFFNTGPHKKNIHKPNIVLSHPFM